MRIREIMREAGRDLASGATRAGLLALTFLMTVGAVILADTASLKLLQNDVASWRDAGGGIVTFAAPGAIDGPACEALGRVHGIVAAGAFREVPGGMHVAQLGARTVRWYEATHGLVELLIGQRGADMLAASSAPSVLLSDAAAREVGRAAGGRLDTDAGTATVAQLITQPDDGRAAPFEYAAVTLTPPTGTFDVCWLSVWPPSEGLSHLVRSTVSLDAPAETRPQYAPLNPTLAATIDPAAMYGARATRWAALVAAALAFTTGFVAIKLRRLEIASALHARVRRRDLAIQHLLETFGWLTLAASLITPVAVAVAHNGSRVAPATLDRHWAILTALAMGSALLGTIAALFVIREEHLLRYFKLH